MEPGNLPMQCRCRECLLDSSQAMVELRDALNSLSLFLKDLRFEIDREQRDAAAKVVDQLMRSVIERSKVKQEE